MVTLAALALAGTVLALVAGIAMRDRVGSSVPFDGRRADLATGASPFGEPSDSTSSRPLASATDRSRSPRAVQVLRRWDRARAIAYARGDTTALKRLYVPGSSAGRSDVAILRSYSRRGLRVEGLRMQLLAVEVTSRSARQLRLRVTDRVHGAVAVGAGSRFRLPRDDASTRSVHLRRTPAGDRWRVEAVRQ